MRYADYMGTHARASRKLYEAVKLHHRSAKDLATAAGLTGSHLSIILHGGRLVRTNDPRVLKLGKLVGVKHADLFEPLPTKGTVPHAAH